MYFRVAGGWARCGGTLAGHRRTGGAADNVARRCHRAPERCTGEAGGPSHQVTARTVTHVDAGVKLAVTEIDGCRTMAA
jgi:hypothetical protein